MITSTVQDNKVRNHKEYMPILSLLTKYYGIYGIRRDCFQAMSKTAVETYERLESIRYIV